ncbi:MAG: hypothetical protein AAF532_12185 [Planctomycetota bacterium]
MTTNGWRAAAAALMFSCSVAAAGPPESATWSGLGFTLTTPEVPDAPFRAATFFQHFDGGMAFVNLSIRPGRSVEAYHDAAIARVTRRGHIVKRAESGTDDEGPFSLIETVYQVSGSEWRKLEFARHFDGRIATVEGSTAAENWAQAEPFINASVRSLKPAGDVAAE